MRPFYIVCHIEFFLPHLDFCQCRSEVSFICSHKNSRGFVIKRPYLPKYRPSNKSYVANNVEWSHMDSSDTEYSNLEWVSRNLNSKLPQDFTRIQRSRVQEGTKYVPDVVWSKHRLETSHFGTLFAKQTPEYSPDRQSRQFEMPSGHKFLGAG